jgi:hypothetical protein
MQGGYSISAEGILTLRDNVANTTFDMLATKGFYLCLESIPSNIYTKVIIYATNILASIFNNLRDIRRLISKDL